MTDDHSAPGIPTSLDPYGLVINGTRQLIAQCAQALEGNTLSNTQSEYVGEFLGVLANWLDTLASAASAVTRAD